MKVEAEDLVSVLKEYKDKKRPELDSVAPDRLKLWKWNWPTDKAKDALDLRHTIGDVFKDDSPRKGWTHIIIKVPASINSSSSEESNIAIVGGITLSVLSLCRSDTSKAAL